MINAREFERQLEKERKESQERRMMEDAYDRGKERDSEIRSRVRIRENPNSSEAKLERIREQIKNTPLIMISDFDLRLRSR